MNGRSPCHAVPERRKGAVLTNYVQQASGDITFARDVVLERGQETIPYRDSTPSRAFRLPDILKSRAARKPNTPASRRRKTWECIDYYPQGSKVLRDSSREQQKGRTAVGWRKPPPPVTRRSLSKQEQELSYAEQLLSGSRPVFRAADTKAIIVLDNALQYRTNVRSTVPTDASKWSSARKVSGNERRVRAHKRWTSLPTALELEASTDSSLYFLIISGLAYRVLRLSVCDWPVV